MRQLLLPFSHGIGSELKRDHRAALEAEYSQAGAQVVAPVATIWKHRKIMAAILNAPDIADRAFSAVACGNVVVQVDQVARSF